MPQSAHQPISQPQSEISCTNDQMNTHGMLKQILDKQIAAAGKAVYRVLWEDGAETEVRPKVLVLTHPEIIKEFESHRLGRHRQSLDQLKSSRTPKKQRSYQSQSLSPPPKPIRKSKPKVSRNTQQLALIPFKKAPDHPKPSNSLAVQPLSLWRPYTKGSFVRQHWDLCSKCNQPGCTGFLSRTKKRKKHSPTNTSNPKLYLCNMCSAATHAECLPSDQPSFANHFASAVIDGIREFSFYCHMCLAEQSMAPQIISPICEGCHTINESDLCLPDTKHTLKSVLSQNDSKLTFRCSQCKSNYHYTCLPAFPDALANFNDVPGKEIIEEMCVAEWKCAYCITYGRKIESVITWRPMRTNMTAPAQGYQPNKTQFREFLVKWKTMSFRHLTWVPASWLARVEASLYREACKFDFVRPPLPEQSLVPRSWMMIDRILDIERFEVQGRSVIRRVFAKFCNLPYDEACWDTPPPIYSDLYPAYKQALQQWETVSRITSPLNLEKRILAIKAVKATKNLPKTRLDYLKAGGLLNYQLNDINWFLQQWELNKLHVHVDNAGFGKTIQTILFLYSLFKTFDIYPFAIVVSEASLTKWLDAFKKWAPDLSVVGYYGSEASCRTASQYEIFRTGSSASNGKSGIKCHAVLFTYQSVASDPAQIVPLIDYWAVCVVDESQRLIDHTDHNDPSFNLTRCNQYITIIGTSLESHARKLSIQGAL
ncbi:hypothetical protein CLU79DRAFT_830715 [Phycomyces nitens]|nr:hypothetical protein CLU79DRAFT_830715 [Phycomyces nitens]